MKKLLSISIIFNLLLVSAILVKCKRKGESSLSAGVDWQSEDYAPKTSGCLESR